MQLGTGARIHTDENVRRVQEHQAKDGADEKAWLAMIIENVSKIWGIGLISGECERVCALLAVPSCSSCSVVCPYPF